MKALLVSLAVFLSLTIPQAQATEDPVVGTLKWFLNGASYNDPDVHRHFWAEDLTYTSGRGLRFGREQIWADIEGDTRLTAEEVEVWYSAEDISVYHVDGAAIVNFTLVAKNEATQKETRFYNTAVMIQEDDLWKAVNWNVTVTADSRE
ncbi:MULTISPECIES: DUF4440 domain-containing protein [Gammaproteobacteria]|uniref:DUF4440 domain-containing protein n=1 Tax=Gammaproteobacteria TaxID=1236 RepID=UPI000DCF76A4|nr:MULTISPECIES: DUF4440 domain-containing protein [Gammaproteobacteria]RTE85818.1 nuclear transport factor 2 family protein [Aliidiomarina sp. B3213]TCZ90181.1 nuclear transport factor 2 family protein [Lysobacter sp. N42]